VASGDTSNFSETKNNTVTHFKALPAHEKKAALLKLIDVVEGAFRNNKVEAFYLENINGIKQGVLMTGSVGVSLNEFGEPELIALLDTANEADTTKKKSIRRLVSFLSLVSYFVLSFFFFFNGLLFSPVKPLITSTPIAFIAWIIMGLLFSTVYLLLTSIFDFIFKPLKNLNLN
jgi:hypothetical protein